MWADDTNQQIFEMLKSFNVELRAIKKSVKEIEIKLEQKTIHDINELANAVFRRMMDFERQKQDEKDLSLLSDDELIERLTRRT